MKNAVERLMSGWSKFLACLLVIFATTGAWAADPVAVWDRNFSSANLTTNGWTLVNWNETHAGDWSTVTIDRNNQGLMINSDSGNSGITVLVKYSGLSKSASAHRVIAASRVSSQHTGDRTGITLKSDGKLVGVWNDSDNGTASGSIAVAGVMAFTYGSNGTYLYYGSDTSSISSTAAWGASGLKAGDDSTYSRINGAAIGGMCDGASRSGYEAAKGMMISGIAVFNKVLSNAEMTSYQWPSGVQSDVQTITVNANTSVSAIKEQLDSENYKAIAVSAADGVTITVDEAFGCIAAVSSEGSVKLVAAEQPADLSGVNFSGVQGSLVRSWITSSVVGVNFKSGSGTDVSGALVTADSWIHDNSANGTSTTMFADSLSTLTWSSGGMWQHSGSTFLTGYLDDGSNGGNGATITLSNVPYATYDVIIYCATDSSGKFLAKTVNGTSYTWDTSSGKAVAGTAAWGTSPQTTAAYGTNTLRVKNLTGPLTIYGTARNSSNRGGIAAFEIVNTTHEATISSAGDYTLAGLFTSVDSSDNYVINVNESATLNIDAATTVGNITFNVASGKTLTLADSSTLTATTISVNGAGMVATSSGSALAGTLKGDGTVAYSAAPSGVTLTDAGWTGTVWLKGIEVTNFRTDVYANSTSGAKVKVSGVTGWISTDYASNAELILDDDTYGFAFKATNANSLNTDDRCSTWKKLSGSGLLTTDDNNYQTPCVKIYDASGFTGSINANAGNVKLVVVFCAENETFSPSIFNRLGTSNGKILVSAGSSGVSVAAGKTWTAPGGIFIDGSLTVNAGATIPAIATGSTGGITAIGGATINGVIDSEISASLEFGLANLSVVDASVTELKIPADTTPSAETFHPFMGSEKLDLTGCTSLMTLKLNLGASSTFDLSKVLLPESCTTVMIDVGSGRDLTGYSVSNLGTATLGFSVTETKEEYANGTFSVANVPSGAVVSVARGNGMTSNATVTDGTARFADYGTVKISGAATDLDLTCTNTIDFAYSSFTGASTWRDYAPVYTEDGVYARAGVYTSGTVGNYIANNSSSMTLAVVGQMSPTANTIFLSLGNSAASGLLLARTAKTDEVTIGYNDGSTVHKITNMTVPNCATSRHVYIITKEDGETTTTFTVYLDGIKWKTLAIAKLTLTGGGVQVGADFGGYIRDIAQSDYDGAAFVVIPNNESETGVLNAMRVYGRVITLAEIAEYTSAFPYVSPNGSSARTFTAASENWIDETPGSEVWENSTGGNSGTPLTGAALNVTANVETEITVNLAAEATYEALTVGGAATTFVPGGNSGDIKVSGMTVVGGTVTFTYGAVDVSGGPMTITEDGDITFDYSAYDISGIYTTTDIPLTSDVDENSTKVHLVAPSAAYRTASLVYTSGHYAMRVTPDHEAGSDVYYTGGYWGTTESTFAVTNASGAATIVLPGDTVVIPAYHDGTSAYFGATLPANVSAIRVEKNFTFESGVDDTAILGGATVTVAEGCTLSFATSWHNLTLGSVTFDGDGIVSIPILTRTASIIGAVSGTATLTIDGTVNVPSTGSIANAVTGAGRIVFEGALPASTTLLTSLQDSSSWTGTVELKDYEEESESFGIINFGNYGNRNSAVALNGVTSTMFTGNGRFPAYPDVTLREIEICEGGWTDGSTGTFSIDPTYTAKLTGRGPITVTTGGGGSVKFIGDHTFDGSVSFNSGTGKQVAFMKKSTDTLPSTFAAKSIVVAGRSNMSIASGKTWTAPGGVKIDGSLTVLTAEKATATSVAPTAYLDGASLTTTVDGEAGTTTYVTDEVTAISDNQATRGAVTVSEPMRLTGSGGAYMSSLTINDGMTLTYDPVITPLRVESAPVFNGTGKLKLAARYAGVTCGKFHLVSYPSSASVSGTLANVIDSSSFAPDVSYTVTEETVGSYKQLVLKVGGYDTNAKPVSIAQFGDSITEGIWRAAKDTADGRDYRGTPNYRIPLMQLLEAYGYMPEARGYRSVGSTDANGIPADTNYMWHTGISAQRIYTGLTDGALRAGFMESIQAHLEQVGVTDIITLKIGTNDSLGGETPDNMFEGWTNLVWKIVRMRPTSKIVVCAPVKIMKSGKETSESNAASLRTKIADYVALTPEEGGFPAGQVTMINGFNIVTGDANYYLTDNIHPNWNGHLQLANAWLPAVTNAFESMTDRAADAYTAQTVASAADAAELETYRAGYVKLATFTNFNAKLSTWSESPYVSVNEAYRTMPMRRVAYFVARKTKASPDTRYVWVDIDADETTGTTLAAFGMPTNAAVNGVVTNLHIYSNSSAIENVAPNVSGVKGTLMRTEKGVNKANGISTDLAPDGPYGFDWNDSINGSGAWGVLNMARIFDGATPTDHRKLLAAQMLFDFNGFNGERQNALGLGNFAVHGPYNTANGSVDHFNLNWTFSTDKDEMPTMDARALQTGVIEIWGKPEQIEVTIPSVEHATVSVDYVTGGAVANATAAGVITVDAGTSLTATWTAVSGYQITAGESETINPVASAQTLTSPTVEEKSASITNVTFDYYVSYTNANVTATVDEAATYRLEIGGKYYVQTADAAGPITFENVDVTGVTTDTGVDYTITASGEASGSAGGTSPAKSSGTPSASGWMAWSKSGDNFGSWKDGNDASVTLDYGDETYVDFTGTNTYTAAWVSTGEVVTVTTNVKFGDVADPEMTVDADAQGGIRIWTVNDALTFQVLTNSANKLWANVSNETVGTPDVATNYAVAVKLDYSTQTYGVTIDGNDLALTDDSTVKAFPLAKGASAMQTVSYQGAGSFISLEGQYMSEGYTADIGTAGSATNVVVSSKFVNDYLTNVLAKDVSEALSPTSETKQANGLNYFESYALGLVPTEAEEKPVVSVTTDEDGKFKVTLKKANGKEIHPAANVALKVTLKAGSTPEEVAGEGADGEISADRTDESAIFTIDPTKMSGNVQYYKVQIDIGAQ